MADKETQGQVDTSWSAPAAPTELALSSTGFDEPLVWPESRTWEEPAEGGAETSALTLPQAPADSDAEFIFPPVPGAPADAGDGIGGDLDAWWEPASSDAAPAMADTGGEQDAVSTVDHNDPLGGLGGALPAADAALPDSFWAENASSTPGDAFLVTTTLAAPTVYAETERAGQPRRRRFDIRGGNLAVIGLISLVSLVLLVMFLSVRGRNDSPTDVSQQRTPGDEIAVNTPLNTVQVVPDTSPPATIDIAGLVPATETTEATAATNAPATTAATTRTTAATQPTTATTAAPATTSTAVTTTVTTTQVEDTTTTIRRTTTSFTLPTIPTPTIPPTPTSFPFPFPNR
jgi:hypothetical protein